MPVTILMALDGWVNCLPLRGDTGAPTGPVDITKEGEAQLSYWSDVYMSDGCGGRFGGGQEAGVV